MRPVDPSITCTQWPSSLPSPMSVLFPSHGRGGAYLGRVAHRRSTALGRLPPSGCALHRPPLRGPVERPRRPGLSSRKDRKASFCEITIDLAFCIHGLAQKISETVIIVLVFDIAKTIQRTQSISRLCSFQPICPARFSSSVGALIGSRERTR